MCIFYLETLFHVYILFGNLISCVYLIWKPYFMCISYLETLFHVYIKTTLILHLDYSLIVFTVLKGVWEREGVWERGGLHILICCLTHTIRTSQIVALFLKHCKRFYVILSIWYCWNRLFKLFPLVLHTWI